MPASLIDRLLSWRVIDPITGCWLPKRCWSFKEYFRITYNGQRKTIHRLSAVAYLGLDLNSKLDACHKPICPYKACFNPEHIYAGTRKENQRDWSDSITHCPHGHIYTLENTYQTRLRHGARKGRMVTHCRTCDKERHR